MDLVRRQSLQIRKRILRAGVGQARQSSSWRFAAAIVDNLPGSIDGVLDPTDVFKSFGYSVDLPNRELHVFDTATYRLRLNDVPRDGAVVRWVGGTIDRLSGLGMDGWH